MRVCPEDFRRFQNKVDDALSLEAIELRGYFMVIMVDLSF